MWCPNDFRRMHSVKLRQDKFEAEHYDKDQVARLNEGKQTINSGRWVNQSY